MTPNIRPQNAAPLARAQERTSDYHGFDTIATALEDGILSGGTLDGAVTRLIRRRD